MTVAPSRLVLVACALGPNLGLVALAALTSPVDVPLVATIMTLPGILFGLRRHAAAFTAVAALLGVLYGAAAVWFMFFGGIVLAPCAVLLLVAAVPAPDPERRRQRIHCYLRLAAAGVLTLCGLLTVQALS